MIISSVRAHPFGAFTDGTLRFQPGLNVVLGPNEAGKSTIFHALRTCLFVPTRLTKPGLARWINPYLPVRGGDYLAVDLELGTPEGRMRLTRRWGTTPASSLAMPDGSAIADEAKIQERLTAALPASPARVANVLMIHQWQLMEPLERLRETARDSFSDLSDIIRRTLLNVGGVLPDRFMTRLESLQAEAFMRWDAVRQGPERDRGIENPWKNEVGTILRAWYRQEETRAEWKKARAFESGLDGVNAALRRTSADLAAREAFVTTHEEAALAARERGTREARLGQARAEAEALRTANREWPVAVRETENLRADERAAEAALAPLSLEYEDALRAEQGRGLRERYRRIARSAAAVETAKATLAGLPRLDAKAFAEVQAARLVWERLQARVEAHGLSVTVAGREAVDLVVQEDLAPERTAALVKGGVVRLRAGGRIRIVHRDMEIEVRSSDSDAAERPEKAAAARQELDALCARHGVPSADAAGEASRSYEAAAADVVSAERTLASELAGDTVASVAEQFQALGPDRQTRPAAVIAAERATLIARREGRAARLAELEAKIAGWERLYVSHDALADTLGLATTSVTDLQAGIARLAPVPAGFADAASFLKEFDAARKAAEDLRVELKGLQVRKEEMERAGPDQSAEELAVQVKDAEEAFRAELRRGEALGRIAAAARGFLGGGDAGLYDGLRARVEETLSLLTGGRHTRVTLSGALPTGLDDGAPLRWEQLSAGTRDSLGLALRLAMAGFFLGDADGFLLMDDPLVDMDPDRQKRAAGALRSFAQARQLVLFTCHPASAAMLGGHLVTLAG